MVTYLLYGKMSGMTDVSWMRSEFKFRIIECKQFRYLSFCRLSQSTVKLSPLNNATILEDETVSLKQSTIENCSEIVEVNITGLNIKDS